MRYRERERLPWGEKVERERERECVWRRERERERGDRFAGVVVF